MGTDLQPYRAMGLAHARISRLKDAVIERIVDDERGQGTVEYIGLVLLMAAVMAVVTIKTGAGERIGRTVVSHIQEAISDVGKK